MSKHAAIVFGALWLFFSTITKGEDKFCLAELDSVVTYIYNFDFERARKLTSCSTTPDEFKLLPLAYSHYWEFISGNEPQKNLRTCTKFLQENRFEKTNDTLEMVYQASVNLLLLRVQIARENLVAPIFLMGDIGMFFKTTKPNQQSDFNMLYWGLLHYYLTLFRETSFAVRPFLSDWPATNKKTGLLILEKLTTSPSVFVRTEAEYFLMRIYLESENDFTKARCKALSLMKRFPDNATYKHFYLKILAAQKNYSLLSKTRREFVNEINAKSRYSLQQKKHFVTLFLEVE
jgi:hypothetical protein